jgi:hypothetical protein
MQDLVVIKLEGLGYDFIALLWFQGLKQLFGLAPF